MARDALIKPRKEKIKKRMDGLRSSEKTIKNDFHSAAFGHWPKVFGQGKGWKPTLWWPLN
jgi:hypothetical protein